MRAIRDLIGEAVVGVAVMGFIRPHNNNHIP
jgi:hypothetical protein